MRPAFSVIFFTTLIGAGQGLFVALYAVEAAGRLGRSPAQTGNFYALGGALALALLAAGLVASFFHLGRPERSWRAAAMWRTSWLSREVIVLPVFMAVTAAWSAAHLAGEGGTLAVGALGMVLCFALFVCTGMIYACISFLREWATPLTVVNYTLLGCACGFSAGAAYAAAAGHGAGSLLGWGAVILTLSGGGTRCAALVRNARLRPRSSLQTAIGIAHPRIEQKSQGFVGGSFNTREFFHGRTAGVVRAVKWTFLALAFPVPAALLCVGLVRDSAEALALAFLVQYAGLVAERWFFFAQADHPQNLYYQVVS
jgi:DMSO reductase anchor subunit